MTAAEELTLLFLLLIISLQLMPEAPVAGKEADTWSNQVQEAKAAIGLKADRLAATYGEVLHVSKDDVLWGVGQVSTLSAACLLHWLIAALGPQSLAASGHKGCLDIAKRHGLLYAGFTTALQEKSTYIALGARQLVCTC